MPAKYKPTEWSDSGQGEQCPGQHQEGQGQQIMGGKHLPLLSTYVAAPGIMSSVRCPSSKVTLRNWTASSKEVSKSSGASTPDI